MTGLLDQHGNAIGAVKAAPVVSPYIAHRDVPEEWERLLALYFPPSEKISWLKLRWLGGDPWEPINRWVIYHMRHPKVFEDADGNLSAHHAELFRLLQGPHPRSTGHYCAEGWCTCAKKAGWWVDGANIVSRHAWELYQETEQYGKIWWIIEGDQGGHRYRLDSIESKISRLHGGPEDTPAPGTLPYAEFDQRVLNKIISMDKVRLWKGLVAFNERNPEALDAEMRDMEREANGLMWNWLESQFTEKVMDQIGRTGAQALRDAAREVTPTQAMTKEDYQVLDEDQSKHDFINRQ